MTAINIGPEVDALCAKFGIEDKSFVGEIVLRPLTASVLVFRQDAHGSKYLVDAAPHLPADEDAESVSFSQVAAADTLEFEIAT